MTFARLSLAAGLLALAVSAGAQQAPTKTFIVQLSDAPVATYDGKIAGLPATRPIAGTKINIASGHVRAYLNYLSRRSARELARVGSPTVVHHYGLAFNGFAANLTQAQAETLKNSASVLSVTESEIRKLDTTRTPAFLGLSTPGGLWSQFDASARKVKGEDVIIGMIDSGVWPEDPSFGDRIDANNKPLPYSQFTGTLAFGAAPAKFHGICQVGQGFTAAMCNNKLIGARYYVAGFDAGGGTLTSFEYRSPRAGGGDGGHGIHTSSTAGGNENVDALIGGIAAGVMSGIAPRARISTYKVCWEATTTTQTGCYTSDTLKAIDDAIADGVDVINFSVSGTQTNFTDPVEIGYFNASAAGIFVAASAGNSGPANTVAHMSPWLTTVAASTHDRYTVANVVLGPPSGATFSGPSYQTAGLSSKSLINAQDAGTVAFATLSAADQTALMRCYNAADRASLGASMAAALDPTKVVGRIVVCIRGGNVLVNKGDEQHGRPSAVRHSHGASGRVGLCDGVPVRRNRRRDRELHRCGPGAERRRSRDGRILVARPELGECEHPEAGYHGAGCRHHRRVERRHADTSSARRPCAQRLHTGFERQFDPGHVDVQPACGRRRRLDQATAPDVVAGDDQVGVDDDDQHGQARQRRCRSQPLWLRRRSPEPDARRRSWLGL